MDRGRLEEGMLMPAVLRSTESVWKHTAGTTAYPPLEGEVTVDVAVVGGGITGMTAALCLQQEGWQVAVVEADRIGSGVSGMNSGHLTSVLLDIRYSRIIDRFGEAKTRLVGDSLQEAIRYIEYNVQRYGIRCDFEWIRGYLYAERPEHTRALLDEYPAITEAGLYAAITPDVPLPFRVEEGILIDHQARFHPLKYVQGLAERFHELGGQIFEQSRITSVSREAPFTVENDKGWIHANHVVLATHTPIGFRPVLQGRLIPYRSYIICVRLEPGEPPLENALFWDLEDPYHYIRLAGDENGPLLIVGGEDHKTGEKSDTERCFSALEQYARKRFPVASVDYRWSAQLYNSADGLPYIGRIAGVYVATGLTGEGLTFGTAAGRIIADQIMGQANPYSEIYSPTRVAAKASIGGVLEENINTARHLVTDRLKHVGEDIEALPPGEGALMQVDGERRAVYKSEDGETHILSPVCRHAGCLVHWNGAEKSWDCPCHGGRYDCRGGVLNGPPVSGLEVIEIRKTKGFSTGAETLQ